jgi:hypothetical protein
MDELEDALVLYKEIKNKFPETTEGQNVDKYIARIEIKLG